MDELFDPYSLVQQQIQNNNEWSAQQAQNQMDFQREMSNTAHQREVADLKAAGLNPVLSAHTQGASTPSGAMGTVDHSGAQALVDLMSQMISADTAKTIAGYGGAGYGGGSYGYTIKGNYRTGPFGQGVQDFLTGFLGMTPREAVQFAGNWVRNNGLPFLQSLDNQEALAYIKSNPGSANTSLKDAAKVQTDLKNAGKARFNQDFSNGNHSSKDVMYYGPNGFPVVDPNWNYGFGSGTHHSPGSFYNKTKDRYFNSYNETSHRKGKF